MRGLGERGERTTSVLAGFIGLPTREQRHLMYSFSAEHGSLPIIGIGSWGLSKVLSFCDRFLAEDYVAFGDCEELECCVVEIFVPT